MRNSINIHNKKKKKKDIKKENIEIINKKIDEFIEKKQNNEDYKIFKNYHIYEKKIYNNIINKKIYFLYLEYIVKRLTNKKYLNKKLLTNISNNNLREYILNFSLYYLKFYNFESKKDKTFNEYFSFLIILSENNIITYDDIILYIKILINFEKDMLIKKVIKILSILPMKYNKIFIEKIIDCFENILFNPISNIYILCRKKYFFKLLYIEMYNDENNKVRGKLNYFLFNIYQFNIKQKFLYESIYPKSIESNIFFKNFSNYFIFSIKKEELLRKIYKFYIKDAFLVEKNCDKKFEFETKLDCNSLIFSFRLLYSNLKNITLFKLNDTTIEIENEFLKINKLQTKIKINEINYDYLIIITKKVEKIINIYINSIINDSSEPYFNSPILLYKYEEKFENNLLNIKKNENNFLNIISKEYEFLLGSIILIEKPLDKDDILNLINSFENYDNILIEKYINDDELIYFSKYYLETNQNGYIKSKNYFQKKNLKILYYLIPKYQNNIKEENNLILHLISFTEINFLLNNGLDFLILMLYNFHSQNILNENLYILLEIIKLLIDNLEINFFVVSKKLIKLNIFFYLLIEIMNIEHFYIDLNQFNLFFDLLKLCHKVENLFLIFGNILLDKNYYKEKFDDKIFELFKFFDNIFSAIVLNKSKYNICYIYLYELFNKILNFDNFLLEENKKKVFKHFLKNYFEINFKIEANITIKNLLFHFENNKDMNEKKKYFYFKMIYINLSKNNNINKKNLKNLFQIFIRNINKSEVSEKIQIISYLNLRENFYENIENSKNNYLSCEHLLNNKKPIFYDNNFIFLKSLLIQNCDILDKRIKTIIIFKKNFMFTQDDLQKYNINIENIKEVVFNIKNFHKNFKIIIDYYEKILNNNNSLIMPIFIFILNFFNFILNLHNFNKLKEEFFQNKNSSFIKFFYTFYKFNKSDFINLISPLIDQLNLKIIKPFFYSLFSKNTVEFETEELLRKTILLISNIQNNNIITITNIIQIVIKIEKHIENNQNIKKYNENTIKTIILFFNFLSEKKIINYSKLIYSKKKNKKRLLLEIILNILLNIYSDNNNNNVNQLLFDFIKLKEPKENNKKENKNKKQYSIKLIFYKIDIQNLHIEKIPNNNEFFFILNKNKEPILFSFYFINYFYNLFLKNNKYKEILDLLVTDTFNFYQNYKSLLKNELKYQENNNYKNIIEYFKKKNNKFKSNDFIVDFDKIYQKSNKINNIPNIQQFFFNSKENNKEFHYSKKNQKKFEEKYKRNRLSFNESLKNNYILFNYNPDKQSIKKSKSFINKSGKFYFENIFSDNIILNNEFLVNLYKRIISQEQDDKFFQKFLFNPKNYLIWKIFTFSFRKIIFFPKKFSNLQKAFDIFSISKQLSYTNGVYIKTRENEKQFGANFADKNIKLNFPSKIKNYIISSYYKPLIKPDLNFFKSKYLSISHSYFNNKEKDYNLVQINFFPIFYLDNNIIECEQLNVRGFYFGKMSLNNDYLLFKSSKDFPLQDSNISTKKKFEYIFSLEALDFISRENKIVYIFFNDIEEIIIRRFFLTYIGYEIFLKNKKVYLFNFLNLENFNNFTEFIKNKQLKFKFNLILNPQLEFKKRGYKKKFKLNEISNFEYLLLINKYALRTYNDVNQYIIFPIPILDCKYNNYIKRDYKIPFIINKKKMKYNSKEDIYEKYENNYESGENYFNSHYSNSGFIFYYLIRSNPITNNGIKFQSGRFDAPARLFYSFKSFFDIFSSCEDYREFIPEFFYNWRFLLNLNKNNFGYFKEQNTFINNVVNEYQNNFYETILLFRKLLDEENEIGNWIDIFFGKYQLDKKGYNIYQLYSYEQYNNFKEKIEKFKNECSNDEEIFQNIREEIAMLNLGMSPIQLFKKPHQIKSHKIEENFINKNEKHDNNNELSDYLNKIKNDYVIKRQKNEIFILTNEIICGFKIINNENLFKKYKNNIFYHSPQINLNKNTFCKIGNETFLLVNFKNETMQFLKKDKNNCFRDIYLIYKWYCLVTCCKYLESSDKILIGDSEGKISLIKVDFSNNYKKINILNTIKIHKSKILKIKVNLRLNIIISYDEKNFIAINNLTNLENINYFQVSNSKEPCIKILKISNNDLIYIIFTLGLKIFTLDGMFIKSMQLVKDMVINFYFDNYDSFYLLLKSKIIRYKSLELIEINNFSLLDFIKNNNNGEIKFSIVLSKKIMYLISNENSLFYVEISNLQNINNNNNKIKLNQIE